LETIKSFKSFNNEIQSYSQKGGMDFVIEFFERVTAWMSDNEVESEYFLSTGYSMQDLHSKDFNN